MSVIKLRSHIGEVDSSINSHCRLIHQLTLIVG